MGSGHVLATPRFGDALFEGEPCRERRIGRIGERTGTFDELGRLIEGELGGRFLGCASESLDRHRPKLVVDCCRLGRVIGEFRQVARIVAEDVVDGDRDSAVHPCLPRGTELTAERRSHECMGEAESVVAHIIEQSGGDRELQIVEQVELVAVGGGRCDPKLELEAEHRTHAQGLLHLLVEAGEATSDGALHVDGAVGRVHRLKK